MLRVESESEGILTVVWVCVECTAVYLMEGCCNYGSKGKVE
jgi:hypothetical protein